MRFIPTHWHGRLDYLVAIFLIALPSLGGLPPGLPRYIPALLGTLTILYSLMTDYELGLIRVIPMRVHLILDLLNGLLLAIAPWLFGFHEVTWKPHLLIGLAELMVTACSIPHAPVSRAFRRA